MGCVCSSSEKKIKKKLWQCTCYNRHYRFDLAQGYGFNIFDPLNNFVNIDTMRETNYHRFRDDMFETLIKNYAYRLLFKVNESHGVMLNLIKLWNTGVVNTDSK